MQTIPAGFFPDEWDQTFGAFKRLVDQLAEMQAMLNECGELTPENCDVAYILEQVAGGVETLRFMASDAETHWKTLGIAVASAVGKLALNKPVDDIAWCAAILDASWRLHNGLRRELTKSPAELCVQRLPLHLGRIPSDIGEWKNRITAEIRAGALCSGGEKPEAGTVEWTVTLAEDRVRTDELSEEDRPSGEWARICGIHVSSFRNRMCRKLPGETWRIVESGSQRYRVHVEDLPAALRSKRLRDDFLNRPSD